MKTYEEDLFELWFDENIEELRIKWGESGADREMDFDEEKETWNEYEKHKNTLVK